mgnify:CR=1 FL=1
MIPMLPVAITTPAFSITLVDNSFHNILPQSALNKRIVKLFTIVKSINTVLIKKGIVLCCASNALVGLRFCLYKIEFTLYSN